MIRYKRIRLQKLTNIIFGILILGGYGIYMYFNPQANGLMFGGVMGLLGLLAGLDKKDISEFIMRCDDNG